jgi:hypothetical protein
MNSWRYKYLLFMYYFESLVMLVLQYTIPVSLFKGPEVRQEVVEFTGEDSPAAGTCAETAARADTGDGTVSVGVTGTARDGHGRTSDQAINQFLSYFFFDVANHFSIILRPFLCFFLTCLRTVPVPSVGRFFFLIFFWSR